MKRASKGMATFTCARGVRFAFSGGRRSTCTQRCPPPSLSSPGRSTALDVAKEAEAEDVVLLLTGAQQG